MVVTMMGSISTPGDGLTSITVNSAVLTQHSTFLNPVPADHLQDPLPSSISLKTDLGEAPARVLCSHPCGYPLWGDSLGNPWQGRQNGRGDPVPKVQRQPFL